MAVTGWRRNLRLGWAAAMAGVAMVVLTIPSLAAEDTRNGPYIENYENDIRKIETFYKKGKRDGRYQEFWPNGRIKIRATYRDDLLTGLYQEYNEDGKLMMQSGYSEGQLDGISTEYFPTGKVKVQATYSYGVLHGLYRRYADDQRTVEKETNYIYGRDDWFKRPAAEMQKELQAIAAEESKIEAKPVAPAEGIVPVAPDFGEGAVQGGGGRGNRGGGRSGRGGAPAATGADAGALRQTLTRLKQARAIAGVPYADITYKDVYLIEAQAATDLLSMLGHLDHHPEQPAGLSDERFKLGRSGCEHGNLAMGQRSLLQAQNTWLFDSDEKNKFSVGHRRWSLNPSMQQLGYGQTANYYTMWAHDKQRAQVPDFAAIPWPAAGYHPVGFFGNDWCWHVSLNPDKYQEPSEKSVKVKMWALGRDYKKQGEPLEFNHFCVNNDGYGVRYAVIWRPKTIDVAPGKAYYIEIEGLKDSNGQPATYTQVTEFIP